MSTKATSIISYITVIGWVIAYCAGDKEGAKFHLNQSLIIVCANLILTIVGYLTSGSIIGSVVNIIDLVIFVLWVMGLIYAIKQEEKEIPIIGGIKILK